jgi:hypothetical protein
LTDLSSGHKLSDNTLDRLLDLDGTVMEVGGGFWVKIEATRVPPTEAKPFGVDYSLCLFGPKNERVIGFDNAHAVFSGRPPSRKRETRYDHRHEGEKMKPYVYANAETLLEDFWNTVEVHLKKEGIS